MKANALVAAILLSTTTFLLAQDASTLRGRTDEEWQRVLESDEGDESRDALAELRGAGREAIPVLVRLFHRAEGWLRRQLASLAGEIDPSAAVPLFLVLLWDEDRYTQEKAAECLGRLGPAAGPAAASLVLAIATEEHHAGYEAREALWRIGAPAIPALTVGLGHERWGVRAYCAEALGEIGPDAAAAVPVLERRLEDGDRRARREAAIALARIAPGNESCVPVLLKWTGGGSYRAENTLSEYLGALVPGLVTALVHEDATVRGRAVDTLLEASDETGIDPDRWANVWPTPEPVPEHVLRAFKAETGRLRELYSGAEPGHRAWIALIMSRAAPDTEGLVGVLREALRSDDASLRRRAGPALGRLGARAAEAVVDLLVAIEDEERDVARAAVGALPRIGAEPERVVPVLLGILRQDGHRLEVAAGRALGEFGEVARVAVPLLVEKLCGTTTIYEGHARRERKVPGVVWPAYALAAMGPAAAEAAPALVGAIGSWGNSLPPTLTNAADFALMKIGEPAVLDVVSLLTSPEVYTGTLILMRLGEKARAAVPALLEMSYDSALRPLAALALARIDRGSPKSLDRLEEALLAWKPERGSSAGRVLRWIGRGDEALAPALAAGLDAEDPSVSRSCALALLRMGEGGDAPLRVVSEALARGEVPWPSGRMVEGLGPRAESLIGAFVRALRDEDHPHRDRVASALGALGARAAAAVPALAERVLQGDPYAAWALVKFGPAAKAAVPALLDARRRHDHLRIAVGKALRSIRRE